jgi:hypothetical protein
MESVEQQSIAMRLLNRLNEPLQSKRPKYIRTNLIQSTGKNFTENSQTNYYPQDKFYLRKTYRVNYSENQNYKYFNNESIHEEKERSRIKFIRSKISNKKFVYNNWQNPSKTYKSTKYQKRDKSYKETSIYPPKIISMSKTGRKASTLKKYKNKDKKLPESPHNTSQFLVSNFPSNQLLKLVLGQENNSNNYNLRQFRSNTKDKKKEFSECSRPISPSISISTRRKNGQSDSNLSFELNNLELTSKIKPGGTMMGLNINRIKKNLKN